MGKSRGANLHLILLPVSFLLCLALSATQIPLPPFQSSHPYTSTRNNQHQDAPPLPGFWDVAAIRAPSLNVTIHGNETVDYNGKLLSLIHLSYTSENWNGSPLRIYGGLVLPDNGNGTLGPAPIILAMHGLGGSHYSMLQLVGYPAAARGYLVLAIDFPGHGQSGGPEPSPEIIANVTGGPEGSHWYRCTVAALRAIQLLESWPGADPNRVGITGASYGGLHTYFASALHHAAFPQAIMAGAPMIAAGDFQAIFAEPTLVHLVLPPGIAPDSPPGSLLLEYFEPLVYAANNPPLTIIAGTNDEFFPLSAFNSTYYAAAQGVECHLSITPNGHHGRNLRGPVDTLLYWFDHVLQGGPAPPSIRPSYQAASQPMGIGVTARVNITSSLPVRRVTLAYRWASWGAAWEELDMTQESTGVWSCTVSPSLLWSYPVCLFVVVELDTSTSETVIFTSPPVLHQASSLWPSLLMVVFLLALGAAGGVGLWLEFRWWRKSLDPDALRRIMIAMVGRTAGVLAAEVAIVSSIFLPWLVLLPSQWNLPWSLAYLQTHFLAASTPLLLLILGLGAFLALLRPFAGALVNLLVPSLFMLMGTLIIPSFPYAFLGAGVLLSFYAATTQFILEITVFIYGVRLRRGTQGMASASCSH